jgi:hypothetical protein
MKEKIQTILLTVVIITGLISCEKNNDESIESKNNELSEITIQEAQSIFICSSQTETKLYGIKKSQLKSSGRNEIFEIKYINADGDTIQKQNPASVFNITNFVLLAFGDEHNFNEAYLVNKDSGKVFKIPSKYMPHIVGNKYHYDEKFFSSMNKIQEDGGNNMYYTTYQPSSPHKKTLYQISLNTPSSLVYKEVSAVTDDIKGFCVDKDGSILYTYDTDEIYDLTQRYRKTDGSFIIFNNPAIQPYTFINIIWTGTDGSMYAHISKSQEEFPWGKIHSIARIDNGELKILKSNISGIQKIETLVNGYRYDYVGNVFNIQNGIFYSQEGVLLNLSNYSSYNEIPCSKIANTVLNDKLYHFDKITFELNHIDTNNGTVSLVYDLEEKVLSNYDIDRILYVESDGITFSAIDLNNGSYIVAKIDINNTITVHKSITGTVTTVLSLN